VGTVELAKRAAKSETADAPTRLGAIRARHDEYLRLKAADDGSDRSFWTVMAQAAHFAVDDVPTLLAVAEAALAGHEPQQVYDLALDLRGRALCDHDPDTIDEDDRHDESEDGDWVCLDKPLPSVCRGCPEVDGERPVWPCEPYKAIAGALGIEFKETTDR
jgi:hypothetical protein